MKHPVLNLALIAVAVIIWWLTNGFEGLLP